MGSGRVSIKTFSSQRPTSRAVFSEQDVEDLFQPNDRDFFKQDMNFDTGEEKKREIQDLEIADSHSGDVFDGVALNPTLEIPEEDQTREDVDDALDVNDPSPYYDIHGTEYGGVREEFLTDDDSDSQFSGSHDNDQSTVLSNDTSFAPPQPSDSTPLICPDELGLEQFMVLAAQYGGSIDKMNQFLFQELEVGGFVGEVDDLRQEVVKNGLEKLDKVEWAELFKSIYNSTGDGTPMEEQPTLASVAAEDRQAPTLAIAAQPQRVMNSSLRGCMPDMNGLVLEEGMEMPYEYLVSCGSFVNGESPTQSGEKKQSSFLSKLFTGQKRDTAKIAAAPRKPDPPAKKAVTRVRLDDGSMASVSIDTVSRLQSCQWV